ncbi:biotin-dependent carboxyltransferase family protein [Saccharopolyspora erythraea]|uniref:5-oxoprolinase subunit C family protein n=1 Tax=Saccharopolyspora erythraea TaxID=1836 RepID=UPI001BA924DE|nr:biotin-dependent carboxyltransferase family protein [Saccharopolyspora erythraea]QUH02275.1 biotin-dependent carboxyltransferase family protein [Saccharopolyspora erythraea]
MADNLVIHQAGISTVQDLGRFGRSRHGLPVNGALDQYSARVANVLVGNDEGAPLVEITMLDFSCTPGTDVLIAVTGAPADVTVDGFRRPQWEPVAVGPGQTVRVAGIRLGARVYLALRGSLEAPSLLGSCAPDTILGFGRSLRDDDELAISGCLAPIDHPVLRHPVFQLGAPVPLFGESWTIDVTEGPDIAEFGASAARLFSAEYTVSPQSNHIGLRMRGEVPQRVARGEVLSRGVPVGAVEVPAGEELLVLHRGRGVTAGYPVLAVVTATGLCALGQVRPGQRVRFRRRGIGEAVAACRARRDALRALRKRVSNVFDALRIPTLTPHAPARETP